MTSQDIMNRIEEIKKSVSTIEGWLSDSAGEILYKLVRLHAPVATAVELGSWKGRSTSWLGFGIKDRGEGQVYSVDEWKGSGSEESFLQQLISQYSENQLFEEFHNNIIKQGLQHVVTPIQSDTIEASRKWDHNKEIGLLFIDASHDYSFVRKDFEFWCPMVKSGGYIVFDDVPSWPGPTQLVSELPKYYNHIATDSNISVFQKI